MTAFRALLACMIAGLSTYTFVVVANHGWGLFAVFFGDIAARTWPGQFNFDFSCFLLLSGTWMAWRNRFTPAALVLGVLGVVGGMSVLAPYLLYLTFRTRCDMRALLLGAR